MKKNMKSAKKSATKGAGGSELHMDFKHMMLIIVAALLSYLALLLRVSNTWSAIINITLLVLLLCFFKSKEGVLIIVSAMVLSVLTLPITVISMSAGLVPKIIIFVINLALLVLIALGLKHLKNWGFYLSIVVFILSIVSLAFITVPYIQAFAWKLEYIAVVLRYLSMIIFYAASIWFLIKHRKYFR
jgi:hypothetical protein